MPPSKLALIMPTYRRSGLLEHGIEQMAPGLIANNVALYVSDDSPDGDTEDMLRRFSGRLPALHYRRNTPASGHDRNIVRSLLWPGEPHVWILGDAGWVRPGGFERVLSLLDGQDMLFVNSHAPETPDVPRMTGEAARVLMRDMLWHQTLTGATIYGRRMLEWLRGHAPDAQGLTRNFPHLCVMLDFLATHDAVVGWAGTHGTRFSPKDSYWRKSALSVFVDDWSEVVRRQAAVIRPDEQAAALRSHDANAGLFGMDLLLDLRRAGMFTSAYLRAHPDARQVIAQPAWLLRAIAGLPLPLLEHMLSLARWVRRPAV